MSTLKITIINTCTTEPAHPHMKKNPTAGDNEVQWHCGDSATGKPFALRLPGGVFEGYKGDFALAVNGSHFVPDPPLKLVQEAKHLEITNYVYDSSGKNCSGKDLAGAPSLIIDP